MSFKRTYFYIYIVSLLFAACPTFSHSNDAPVNLKGGGLSAISGVVAYISMESEVVKIVLEGNYYTVDATFNFINSGETARVDVGFPKRGIGWLGEDFHKTSDFIKFETWVNGEPAGFTEVPDHVKIWGNYTLPGFFNYIKQTDKLEQLNNLLVEDFRWMVKEVRFASKKTTVTRVRYEAPYLKTSECKNGLTYIYGTGSHWKGEKGIIGESKFILDSTAINEEDRPKGMNFDRNEESKAKCSNVSDGVMECVIKDYIPEENADVFIGIGCADL